jgi:transposase
VGGGGFVEQQVIRDYGVGIDCHSRFLAVCVLVLRTGKVYRAEKDFPVDWPSLLEARAWVVEKLGDRLKEPLRYSIESTGTYHMPVLRAWGGQPTVVNPLLQGSTRRKTDKLDAKALAHQSITGLWPASFIASDAGLKLRVLWAARGEAARAATRCSNRVNNIVLRFGHTIAAAQPIRSAVGRALISELVGGGVPSVPNVAPDGLPPEVRPVIGGLMDDLEMFTRRAKDAQKACEAFVTANTWPTASGELPGAVLLELLQTVPGVGEVTAMAWLAEVLDPRRFECAEQVAAFAGCDPSLKVSAGKVTEYVRRKGNVRLHRALLFAASTVMREPDSRLAAWGRSIAGRHRKGGYKRAVSAMARRVAAGLWHIHRLGKPFDLAQYHFGKPPRVVDAPVEAIGLTAGQSRSLPPGLKTCAQVAEAFWKGELGQVRGLGAGAMKKISDWIASNRAAPAAPRQYLLKPKTYERKDRRRPCPEGRGGGTQTKGSQTRGKDEVLHHPVREGAGEDLPGGPVVGLPRAARHPGPRRQS